MRYLLKMIVGAAASILILAALSCHGTRNENLLRLTDLLDQKNVLQSPLMTLGERFVPVTQKVPASELRPVEKDGQKYWGFTSASRVFSFPEEEVPEKATLRRDAEEWRYSDTPLMSYPAWRRLQGDQDITLLGAPRASNKKGVIRLSKGQALAASLFLPPGDALFEFSAVSDAPNSLRQHLFVTVNGRARDIVLGASANIRFVERVPLGNTSLKISFGPIQPVLAKVPKQGHEIVEIKSARVRTMSDLILLSLPSGQKTPTGTYDFTFIPEPAEVFLPIGKNLASGELYSQKIELPAAGFGTLGVSGRSPSGAGRLRLWLGTQELGSREVPDDGYFYYAYPVSGSKAGPEVLRASFEPASGPVGRQTGASELNLDSIVWHNPQTSLELPLYKLKNTDLLDAGTGPNPWGIKKKLRVRGSSYNMLLAPSLSRFQFKMRIPVKAVLRLGYGLLKEADESDGDGAGFEVSVELGGEKKVLFSDFRDPSHKPSDRDVFFKDIDLAAYAKKSITLSLRTFGSLSAKPGSPDSEDLRGDLAFWVNPLIFPRDAAAGPEKKNVILISMDATRADHIGCYGYRRDTTPSLDRMAADSVLFLNTISQAPYTLASHMTMLTGYFPTTHRVFYFSDSLNSSFPTLADRLRGRGLVTAAFTGGGLMDARYGYARGFDEFHDHIVSQESMDTISPLSRKVADWLAMNKDLNFFLFLHTYQVHSPYWPPPAFAKKFIDKDATWMGRTLEQFIGAGWVNKYRRLTEVQRRNVIALYDADICFLDDALIRPLVEELKRRNLYDNTMIIITADHGEEFFDHVTWGHSNTVYNELLKVPLVMKFPKSRYGGLRMKPYVRLADIAPTVMDEFGASSSPVKPDGESVLPILENKETKERLCMSYLPGYIFADPMPSKISVIQGRYKLILNEKFPARAYTYFSPPPPEVAPIELFDLRLDPLERRNLANQESDVARRMLKQAQTFLQAAKREGLSKKALMDNELEERLRALGYIK